MSFPEYGGIRIQITTNYLYFALINSNGHQTYKQKFGYNFIISFWCSLLGPLQEKEKYHSAGQVDVLLDE
jgi:hypothetical protein